MKHRYTWFLTTIFFLLFLNISCQKSEILSTKVLNLKDAKIAVSDSKNQSGLTTLDKVIYPDQVFTDKVIKPWDVTLFSKYNYGKWHFGSGVPYEKKLDLMPDRYPSGSDMKTFKLLSFFAMTDIHITDKESPALQQRLQYRRQRRRAPSAPIPRRYAPAIRFTSRAKSASTRRPCNWSRVSMRRLSACSTT